MPDLSTSQLFSAGDLVTAESMNNIISSASLRPESITSKTEETLVVAADDYSLVYDASSSSLKKARVKQIRAASGSTDFVSDLTVKKGDGSNGFSVAAATGNTSVAGTLTVTGALSAPNLTASVNGPMNGSIGATTPSTGSFTTVSASGALTVGGTITSTGNITGNLVGNVTGDVTGNLTGNVTGNVTGTVTNGVVTTGSYSDPSWLTLTKTKVGLASVPNTDCTNASNISAGTLANARTTAVSTNTASAIVARDTNGNFSAGTITATLTGVADSAKALTNGALGIDNTPTTYGSWKVTGTKGGYAGFEINAGSRSHVIFDANGNGGLLTENETKWAAYWSAANDCLGVGTNTTSAGNSIYAASGIYAGGNITAYSDERVKDNWKPLDADFIKKLSQVKSGTYDRTDIKTDRHVGVSAQSLRSVLPEAVMQANDERNSLSVVYGNAALVSCIELAKEVTHLKEQIEYLKSKLGA